MIAGNRPNPLLHMVGGLALVVAIVAVGLYLAGWLIVQNGPDSATIQIKTREIRSAADEAVEKGRAMLDDTAASPGQGIASEVTSPAEQPAPVVR
jgi:hypothetical protein